MNSRVDVWITTDAQRKVALVSGREAARVARMISPTAPRYSRFGRGWIIAISHVEDAVTYCAHAHFLAVVHARKDGAA